MDRLTKRNEDGSVSSTINCPAGCKYFTCSMEEGQVCHHECEADYMCKLAEYEDAEEQGLLKNFIVDVGTKVWTITNPANYSLGRYAETVLKQPQEKKVQSITISKNGILYHVKDRTYGTFDFGKTVFLTREEAEQALAKDKIILLERS